jgi:hypothetical protein
MQTSTTTEAKPTITVVPDNQRMTFLPRHYKNLMMVVENTTYNLASQNMRVVGTDGDYKPYSGGYWNYATGPSGAPFLSPKTDNDVEVTNPLSGESYTLSPELGGIYLSMLTLQAIFSHRVWDGASEDLQDYLIETYHNLRDDGFDLARDDDERTSFFRLID